VEGGSDVNFTRVQRQGCGHDHAEGLRCCKGLLCNVDYYELHFCVQPVKESVKEHRPRVMDLQNSK
jgi:hypothetical protein